MDHKFEEADSEGCTPMWERVTKDGGDFNVIDNQFSLHFSRMIFDELEHMTY